MPIFPSSEWFEAAREAVNEDAGYRALGTCNASVGVKVGDRAFAVDFEGFECTGTREIGADAIREVDFYLDMELDGWKDLLGNIRANGEADTEHSLNRLDLMQPGGLVKAANEYHTQTFLRIHLSLQRFFDVAGKIDTTYP